jgi:hypothetical protein
VLYAHTDEIVFPHPSINRTLVDYVDTLTKDFLFCTAYTILQDKDEADLDMTKPLLPQRKWWWREWQYNKPLLAKIPLNWTIGYHSIEEIPGVYTEHLNDNNLILLHFQQANLPFYKVRSDWRGIDRFRNGMEHREEIPEEFKRMI